MNVLRVFKTDKLGAVISFRYSGCSFLNPFKKAVPFYGQTGQIPSSLSPKRDCSFKEVNRLPLFKLCTSTAFSHLIIVSALRVGVFCTSSHTTAGFFTLLKTWLLVEGIISFCFVLFFCFASSFFLGFCLPLIVSFLLPWCPQCRSAYPCFFVFASVSLEVFLPRQSYWNLSCDHGLHCCIVR